MKAESINEKAMDIAEDKTSSRATDISLEEEKIVDAEEAKNVGPNPSIRTQSRKSEIDPFSEPPDGGLNAWLKVLGCFLIYSNIWYALRHRPENTGLTHNIGASR
jgi:hypothetical protein